MLLDSTGTLIRTTNGFNAKSFFALAVNPSKVKEISPKHFKVVGEKVGKTKSLSWWVSEEENECGGAVLLLQKASQVPLETDSKKKTLKLIYLWLFFLTALNLKCSSLPIWLPIFSTCPGLKPLRLAIAIPRWLPVEIPWSPAVISQGIFLLLQSGLEDIYS